MKFTFLLVATALSAIPDFRSYKSWRGGPNLLRPVGSQGCGDCFAWAGTWAVNSRLNIKNGNKDLVLAVMDGQSCHKVLPFEEGRTSIGSGQCPINNDIYGDARGQSSFGCSGGDAGQDIFEYAKKHGILEDSCMPYRCAAGEENESEDPCRVREGVCKSNVCNARFFDEPAKCENGNDITGSAIHKVLDWFPLRTSELQLREQQIMKALDDGPASFGLKFGGECNLGQWLNDPDTKTNIFTAADASEGCFKKRSGQEGYYTLDHDTLLVGYGEENGVKFWEIQNSHGTNSGDDGFFRLVRDFETCGSGNDISIPVVAADQFKLTDVEASRARRMQRAEDATHPQAGQWSNISSGYYQVLEAATAAARAVLEPDCFDYVNTGAGSVTVFADTARFRLTNVYQYSFEALVDGGSGTCASISGRYSCFIDYRFMSSSAKKWVYPDCTRIGDLPSKPTAPTPAPTHPSQSDSDHKTIVILAVLTGVFGLLSVVLAGIMFCRVVRGEKEQQQY